ncbi:ribonuclease H-like domain-containing protein [Tanacetum coccineum]|uniref:Ribonuclease H-like domain-containing protein n=1 Tax=Tanacetum coccineum TaxID=301880 RepID=A0ABQ5H1V6_9ASTR
MASLDHRLNPLFSIKECMSCGALYTRNCGCSKGSLEDKILVPVPDSSQRPPQNCATCGNPVDGLNCRSCAFVRKCLNEGIERSILDWDLTSVSGVVGNSESQVSFNMKTKPGIDTLIFDDLYNNLRVFDSSGHKPQREGSSSYADDLIFSFANQSSGPQLDHEDLEQIDEFDLEKIGLKMERWPDLYRGIKKFYKKTGRRMHFDAKEPVGFDKPTLKFYNCHKKGHFVKECRSKGNQESRRRDAWNSGYKAKDNETRPGKQEETKALVTLDGDGVDWTSHSEDEQDNHAFMAYSSSGSDT